MLVVSHIYFHKRYKANNSVIIPLINLMFLKKLSEKDTDIVFYIYPHIYHFQYSSVLLTDLSYYLVVFSFGLKLVLQYFLQGRSTSTELSQFLLIWEWVISASLLKDRFVHWIHNYWFSVLPLLAFWISFYCFLASIISYESLSYYCFFGHDESFFCF